MLLFLTSACATEGGARRDLCGNAEQCHANCAAAVPTRAGLPLQSLTQACNVQARSLIQAEKVKVRSIDATEDEHEEGHNTEGGGKEAKKEERILEVMNEEAQKRKFEVGNSKARAPHASLSNLSIDNGRIASGAAVSHATGVMSPPSLQARAPHASLSNLSGDSGRTASGAAAAHVTGVMSQPSFQTGQQPVRNIGGRKAIAPHAFLSNLSTDSGRTTSGGAAAHATGVMSQPSLPMGQQPVKGRSLLGTTAFKLNHTAGNERDNETRSGLRPIVQSQQLIASFDSGIALLFRYAATTTGMVCWYVVMVCVCFGGYKFSFSRSSCAQSRQDAKATALESMLCLSKLRGSTGHLTSSSTRSAVSAPGTMPVSSAVRSSVGPVS